MVQEVTYKGHTYEIDDFVYVNRYLDGETTNGFGKIVGMQKGGTFGDYVVKLLYDNNANPIEAFELVVGKIELSTAKEEFYCRLKKYDDVLLREAAEQAGLI